MAKAMGYHTAQLRRAKPRYRMWAVGPTRRWAALGECRMPDRAPAGAA